MIFAIILTWNSGQYVEGCLRSLAADARRAAINLEACVVDGGSTDETLKILSQLAEEIPRLRTVQLRKNLGTTVSRNMAIRQSRGKYILILDSDTEILPGALGALCGALERAPRAGIVAPRLLYPDGSVQPSCKRFPTAPLKACKFVPLPWLRWLGDRAEVYPPQVYSKSFTGILRVDHCISACWLVRREAIEAVGLLDERIFYAPEDVDYCLRMWLAGWEVLYVPSAEIVHHTQRQSYTNWRMAWVHAKGLLYYFQKHGYWLTRRGIYQRISRAVRQYGIEPPLGLR